MVHCISLELVGIRLPDETGRIESAIREMGPAYAFTKSTWLLESELENEAISQRLVGLLRQRDRLLVTRVYKDWIAANLTTEETEWLGSRNYTGVTDPPLFRR